MSIEEIIRSGPFLAALGGGILGASLVHFAHRMLQGHYRKLGEKIISEGEDEARRFREREQIRLQELALENQRQHEKGMREDRRKVQKEEERVKQREDALDKRWSQLESKTRQVEKKEEKLKSMEHSLQEREEENQAQKGRLKDDLERVAGLTAEEAKAQLLAELATEVKVSMANLTRKQQEEAKEKADHEARRIICSAIDRLAVDCVSESTVSLVSLPSEEMKGRVIGREGRNIRSLEKTCGVNFIIDDTPNTVLISCFDPLRRAVAKVALTELVHDGRIHPTRIEEAVTKAKSFVQKQIKSQGEDAALRVGIVDLHPEICILLGKLHFRYSFGQNVLSHSLEVSHLMGIMAAELGLDATLAKRIGLLHDMGKAVSHEMEGSHAVIGHDLALKYGESKAVANGIGSHHHEMAPITLEGSLCSAADALSAARPGARVEAVEQYVKRVKNLEKLANKFKGVENAYALQAGREIRVHVKPDELDDHDMTNLARDMAQKLQKELQYPGKIKVTIIREQRAIEYAV